jgi:flagellar protein FliL
VIRLVFIVIAFLMMVGAAVGGLYFWGIDPLAKLGIVNPTPHTDEPPPAPPPPSYVDFGLLIVPVIQDREVKKQVEMILRLEVPADKKELVANNLPRLQNAYLQDMMAFMPLQLRDGQRLDVPGVRRRLMMTGEKVMGPGLIKDVMIENPSVK